SEIELSKGLVSKESELISRFAGEANKLQLQIEESSKTLLSLDRKVPSLPYFALWYPKYSFLSLGTYVLGRMPFATLA
ncbi:MAG: hypothetical protein SGPRY_012579, partial [Prymnesium sp.]